MNLITVKPSHRNRLSFSSISVYLISIWALLFSVISVYLGGGIGRTGTIILSVTSIIMTLATLQSWGRPIPRLILLCVAWSTIVVLFGIAANGIVFDMLRVISIVPLPVDWKGFLYRFLSFTGGLLMTKTFLYYQRRSRGSCIHCGGNVHSKYINRILKGFAYSAFMFTGAYGALKLYWSLGGTSGLGIVADGFTLAQPGVGPIGVFIAGWGTVILAVMAMLIALATVQSWGRFIPRWILLSTFWIGFALLAMTLTMLPMYFNNFHLSSLLEPNPLWAISWGGTALSYQYRTRKKCKHCGSN